MGHTDQIIFSDAFALLVEEKSKINVYVLLLWICVSYTVVIYLVNPSYVYLNFGGYGFPSNTCQ